MLEKGEEESGAPQREKSIVRQCTTRRVRRYSKRR